MKMMIYFMEQIVFAFTWSKLYGVIFPITKIQRWGVGIVHTIVLWGVVPIFGEIFARQMGAIISIGISSLIIAFVLKRQRISSIAVEILVAYILTKVDWLVSLVLTYLFISNVKINGLYGLLLEGITVCVIQIFLCIIESKYIDFKRWRTLTTQFSFIIITISSVLFVLSYAIIAAPYYQGQREFNNFVMLVIGSLVVIIVTWAFNDYQHHKELEAQSQHINDLVRMAHRYKEIIPAISQELRHIAAQTGNEIHPELAIAMEEVEVLWRSAQKLDREELKKVPNLDETGLPMLDGQLQMEWAEAEAAGVILECVVMTPAAELLEKERVELFHLMQLVGDLFRNAFRAIERQGTGNGHILLLLGRAGEGYEIKMRDSGAPFPREVLERIGERGLTTGGTGHGVADMLELLALYRASLEIREEQKKDLFTKTVCIRFDGYGMVRVEWPNLDIAYERPLMETAGV